MTRLETLKDLYMRGHISYKLIMYFHIRMKVDSMKGKQSIKVRYIMKLMGLSKSTVYRALRMIPSDELINS